MGLVPIWSPLTSNEFALKGSNYIMAVLNVKSFYTNKTIKGIIEYCAKDLFFENTSIENLTKEDVCDSLSSAAKELFYIFNNSLYYQVDVVAEA